MKKKTIIKIITIIILMLLILGVSSRISFANPTRETIYTIGSQAKYSDDDLSKAQTIAGKVLTAIRNFAIMAAVITISITGVKYMIGSVEEKAGYKKSLIPLCVGILIVAAAASILKALYSMAD